MTAAISDPRQDEAETVKVEELIRYAHRRLESAGVAISATKVTKVVRRLFREHGPADVQAAVDRFVAESWTTGGDPYFSIALPYADPTGNTAARNVDRREAA